MTDLLELTQIMDGYKLRQIEVLTRPIRPGVQESRYRQMYHALANGEIHTEEEAAQLLGLDVKGRPFRRFLLEFRRRMYAPLLFLDTENSEQFNATQKANFECLRKLGIFQTLLHRKCLINAAMLAAEIVEIAAQNDVTFVALEMSTYLKRYFVEQEPNPDKYRYYKAYVDRFRFDWEAENKALEYYSAVIAPAIKKKSNQYDIALKSKELLNILEPYSSKCNTILFLAGYYGVMLTEKMSLFAWKKALDICDIAIERLRSKSCFSPRMIGFFMINKTTCLSMLGQYEEAIKLNIECADFEVYGSRGWFVNQDVQVSVALRAGEYSLAHSVAEKVISNPMFKLMPKIMHESWQILFSYISVIQSIGKVKLNANDSIVFQQFKLNKFLNDVPTYSKDKKGLNIPILIVQLLFLLHQKEYEQAHERLESLRKYRVKHFRYDAGNFRTQLFLKAITTMAGSAFNKKKFIKKSQPFIEQLRNTPIGHPDQHYKIEIIPYTLIWNWMVEMIDQ